MNRVDGLRRAGPRLVVMVILMIEAGCLSNVPGQLAAFDRNSPDNPSVQIVGNPPAQVLAGQDYLFTPIIIGNSGDAPLTFSVGGLPDWARFDSALGTISGTPSTADVGVYAGITISVSDGHTTHTLGPFSIEVLDEGAGSVSVTVSWTPPQRNSDGSVLTDLAGYRIYWGKSSGNYPNSVRIDNPSVTRYVVENLETGTYEFTTTAVNRKGVESRFSDTATKTIR